MGMAHVREENGYSQQGHPFKYAVNDRAHYILESVGSIPFLTS